MAVFSLGYVNANPGTPVQITNNESDKTKTISCNSILVQTRSTSNALIYVGRSNMDKTTGVGLLAVLSIPTVNSIPSFSLGNPTAMAAFNATELYIDSTSSTSGVLSSYIR